MVRFKLTQTRSFALMDVTKAAYKEIITKLRDAGYGDALVEHDGDTVLDMHGIAIRMEKTAPDRLHYVPPRDNGYYWVVTKGFEQATPVIAEYHGDSNQWYWPGVENGFPDPMVIPVSSRIEMASITIDTEKE